MYDDDDKKALLDESVATKWPGSYQNDTWSMIERESVDSRGVRVAGGHVKVVIMYQPPCADYKLRSLPAPPKPPRPPRLLGKPPVR